MQYNTNNTEIDNTFFDINYINVNRICLLLFYIQTRSLIWFAVLDIETNII